MRLAVWILAILIASAQLASAEEDLFGAGNAISNIQGGTSATSRQSPPRPEADFRGTSGNLGSTQDCKVGENCYWDTSVGNKNNPSAVNTQSDKDKLRARLAGRAQVNSTADMEAPSAQAATPLQQEALQVLGQLKAAEYVDELASLLARLELLTARFPPGLQKNALQDAIKFYRAIYDENMSRIAIENANQNAPQATAAELSPDIQAWRDNRPAIGQYPAMSEDNCKYWRGTFSKLSGCSIQPYDLSK